MTLDEIIINLGDDEFCLGLTYTALSRSKSLEKIAFDPMPSFDRITKFAKRAKFLLRLTEDERLRQLQIETLERLRLSSEMMEVDFFDEDI